MTMQENNLSIKYVSTKGSRFQPAMFTIVYRFQSSCGFRWPMQFLGTTQFFSLAFFGGDDIAYYDQRMRLYANFAKFAFWWFWVFLVSSNMITFILCIIHYRGRWEWLGLFNSNMFTMACSGKKRRCRSRISSSQPPSRTRRRTRGVSNQSRWMQWRVKEIGVSQSEGFVSFPPQKKKWMEMM